MKKKSAVRKADSSRPPDPAVTDVGPLTDVWQLGGELYLPLRLILVAKLIDRYLARLLDQETQLSLAEWRVTAQLGFLPYCTVKEMTRYACVDQAEVSRSVASLVRRGFVQRELNETDRRSRRFALTQRGRTYYARFHPHWMNFCEQLMTLAKGDAAATDRTLAHFARTLLQLLGPESRRRAK